MKRSLLILSLLLCGLWSQAQIIVSGEITQNTTWTNNNIYIISGWLYVRDGAALTIEPGTLIKGDFATKGALIVERGAKLYADGTAEQPIVFTSQKAPGERYYGDWGGIILCGKASINVPENVGNGTAAGENIIEGGVGSIYGGGANPDDDDNSGILRYVRIEYGGIAFQPNSEINGLTCGGVGRGTIIDHVQVSFCGDDSFEFFGGTVNCTHLVAYKGWDDDFDTDFGYRGNIQFAFSVRDPQIADQSGSNGFESDNDGQGSSNTPITNPVFSNVTILGPLTFTSGSINSNYKRALHLRRNTKTSTFNSVFVGYPVGLFIDGTAAQTNANAGELRFKNNALVAMTDTLATTSAANPNNINGAFNIDSWIAGTNTSFITTASEMMMNSLTLNSPNAALMANSPLLGGADFSDSYLSNSFFTPTTYRGAFGSENWTSCWAEWDPQNQPYNAALDYTISVSIEAPNGSAACSGSLISLNANTNAEGATYQWSNGSSEATAVVSAPSTTTLVVTDSRGCQAESAAFETSSFPEVNVSIEADGPTSFCTGGSVVLTSNVSNGNLWSTGTTDSSIEISASGTYSTTVTDANGCTGTSNTITVSVSDSPAPTISSNGETTICDGETLVLSSSTGETYQWYLNGNAIADATSANFTATVSGGYSVSVTNTNACDGTGSSEFVFVTVNPTPAANFDVDFTIGSGVYEFNNNTVNGVTYDWNFGDGSTSTEVNPTHTYTTGGNYTVVLTATNNGCSNTYEMALASVGTTELEVSSFQVYPNPANESLNIQLASTFNRAIASIYSPSGQQIQQISAFQGGQSLVQISTSELTNGFYILILNVDGQAFSTPFIVRH